MTKDEAYRIIKRFNQNDNPSKNDEFMYIEASSFLLETCDDKVIARDLGGYYYEKEKYDLAEKYYLIADRLGDFYAPIGLGYIYYYGRNGEKNFEKAFYYYNKAKDYNDEACLKIADMYHNGYGVLKDDKKYKKILFNLLKKNKNSDNPSSIIPEISHRIASIYIKEGKPDDAISILNKGYRFIKARLSYHTFWGNYIIARRIVTMLYELVEYDKEDISFMDLFYVLRTPKKVIFHYNLKDYLIESFIDNDNLYVKCEDKYYKSIEDFLIKHTFSKAHTGYIDFYEYFTIEEL